MNKPYNNNQKIELEALQMNIPINNGMQMTFKHNKENEAIEVTTDGTLSIPEGDFVMLINYYRYIKNNDIQCDFINYHGTK